MTIDDYSSLLVTIGHFSWLFATILTIRDYSHHLGLFTIRYSRLFAIRYSGFPDTLPFQGAHFSKVLKSFHTRKAVGKSQTLWLQSCFIYIFLIWPEVPFIQEVSGI